MGGSPRWIVGISSRTPATMLSGLPVGVEFTPMNTARSPFMLTEALLLCAPSSMVATSRRRTRPPFADFTTISRKSSRSVSPVSATMSTTVKKPLAWPGADWKLFARIAASTSAADRPRAASRSGSSQMRIAKGCPPRISACATPGTVASSGWTTRVR